MSRRPLVGVGLSLAAHAFVFALVIVGLSRADLLPALIVDLRDSFLSGAASVGPPASGGTPSTRPPRRPSEARSEDVSARRQRVPAPSTVTARQPPPVAETLSAPPAELAIEPPREMAQSPRPSPQPDSTSEPPSVALGETRGGGAKVGGGAAAAGESPSSAGRGTAGRGDGEGARTGSRQGQPLALTTLDARSGVGPEYGPYLTVLRQRIQQSVRYPAAARRRGASGTVNVEILILPNGAVADVTLLDSSAHQVLDEAALDTIRSLPRMPLPPHLPARPLRVRVPVVFEIR